MRYLLSLAFVVMSACSCTPTHYAPPQHVMGTALGPMETRELLRQALAHSHYPAPDHMPIIDVLPEWEWEALFCGGKPEGCNTLGVYMEGADEKDVVHVRDLPPGNSRTYRSIAVHELTHWLQGQNGKGFTDSCVDLAANEMEAYEVEYLNDLDNGLFRSFEMGDVLGECMASKQVHRVQ